MKSTADERACPLCGHDVIVVNQLERCTGCAYVSIYGHACPNCGGALTISNTQSTCDDCTYSRRFPAD